MRRFARRRNILAAFSAIMGRLGKGSQSSTRPIFRVHYRKLVDEYSQQEQLKFMPALPDYMSYCCCRCGHTQELKVSSSRKVSSPEISINLKIHLAHATWTKCKLSQITRKFDRIWHFPFYACVFLCSLPRRNWNIFSKYLFSRTSSSSIK